MSMGPQEWQDRVAECPDEDASELERIEISFAMPVLMTQDQQRRLMDLIDDITKAPWNQPQGGVHWVSECGSKPNWSQADRALLGLPSDPNAPASGEPTFDDSVFSVGTAARPFVTVAERDRVLKERGKPS